MLVAYSPGGVYTVTCYRVKGGTIAERERTLTGSVVDASFLRYASEIDHFWMRTN